MKKKTNISPVIKTSHRYNFFKASNIQTNCLNTLRFISSFIIAFVFHYKHLPCKHGVPFEYIFKWSYKQGFFLVELFFMISGFGMFLGYGNKIIKHQISFKEYILKRIIKIYPLFLFSTIIITFLEIWHIHLTGKTFVYINFDCWHFFINLILCQDGIFGTEFSFNAPSWCISICFILYIIHFTVLYFSKNKTKALYIYVILMFIALGIRTMNWNYPFLLNQYIGRGLSCFSIGVILAYIYLNSDKLNTTLIGYLSLIILAFFYYAYNSRYNKIIGNMNIIFIMVISPLIIFSVIYVSWINKLFSLKLMIYLGSLSINIYLLHFIMQCTIRNIDIYYKLNLNYSSKKVWFLYCCSTIGASILYNLFVNKIVNFLFFKFIKAFLKNK